MDGRFCKECMEICNRPISYENALLSFGSSIATSREKCLCIGGMEGKISFTKSFFWGGGGGGGGEAGTFGGKLPPPPPPPLDRTQVVRI